MSVSGEGINIIKMTEATDSYDRSIVVQYIRWVGATTAGHALILSDLDGNTVFESEADGPNFIDIHPFYRRLNGLVVTTMTSGTLYIYVR